MQNLEVLTSEQIIKLNKYSKNLILKTLEFLNSTDNIFPEEISYIDVKLHRDTRKVLLTLYWSENLDFLVYDIKEGYIMSDFSNIYMDEHTSICKLYTYDNSEVVEKVTEFNYGKQHEPNFRTWDEYIENFDQLRIGYSALIAYDYDEFITQYESEYARQV